MSVYDWKRDAHEVKFTRADVLRRAGARARCARVCMERAGCSESAQRGERKAKASQKVGREGYSVLMTKSRIKGKRLCRTQRTGASSQIWATLYTALTHTD